MKWVAVVGMMIIGTWVLMGTYPAFKSVLGGADTAGYGTLLAAMVSNLWLVMLFLGVVAVVSIWWLRQK